MSLQISQIAINHIIAEEVSSPAYYERHYRRPEWPGGASGVTIGVGYDLGYASKDKIRADWGSRVPAQMLRIMMTCSGVKGGAAKALLASVRPQIEIPWDMAYEVFISRDIPQWTATCERALPNFSELTATCKGIEVGLAYNRGAGGFTSNGDRFREMRQIRSYMTTREFALIPGQHRSMARLWRGTSVNGVADRRLREAALFEKGLKEPAGKVVEVAKAQIDPDQQAANREDQRARTPQPKTTPAQNTTSASVGAAPPAAAKQAGYSNEAVAMITAISLTIAIISWVVWYRNRNPKGGFAET